MEPGESLAEQRELALPAAPAHFRSSCSSPSNFFHLSLKNEVQEKPEQNCSSVGWVGSTAKQVTTGAGEEIHPNWLRDGNSMYFSNAPDDLGALPPAIYRLDLSTQQVTTVRESEGKWFSRLSPDDQHIAALSIDKSLLMLFDVKAQKWTHLTQTTVRHPAWSHDGKYLYFDCIVSASPPSLACRSAIGSWSASPV